MCYGFFSIVPGLDPSATDTITAGSFSPLSAPMAEVNIREINEKLYCQLEVSQQQYPDLKKQFFISEGTVYALANQLWKCSRFCRFIVTQVVNEHLFSMTNEMSLKLDS
jgi:hypothetical protein